MSESIRIRRATESDTREILEIYRPFVEDTWVSFEESSPSADEFAARIQSSLDGWDWLVAESSQGILGYAYGTVHRKRAAYRWSVEVSAYIREEAQRMGVAGRLYRELFDSLSRKGFANAYAGIALPNDASVAFHEHMGFEPIGVFPRIGRKFDTWIDVAWYHRPLSPGESGSPHE